MKKMQVINPMPNTDPRTENLGYRETDYPTHAEVRDGRIWVTLADGRIISTPLAWYPTLMRATPEQLQAVEVRPVFILFTAFDLELTIRAMLLGDHIGV